MTAQFFPPQARYGIVALFIVQALARSSGSALPFREECISNVSSPSAISIPHTPALQSAASTTSLLVANTPTSAFRDRVPIIPQFRPVHVDVGGAHLDFGDVFDVPRLEAALDARILEWRQVKDVASETLEDLGCWDIQNKTWEAERLYLEAPVDLNLDLSYTLAPKWIQSTSDDGGGDPNMLMWPLASLVRFNQRATLPPPTLSPAHRTALPPDEHLFCCNTLYFGISALEAATDVSPAWRAVGQHLHFTPKIQDIAASYTRRTLGVTMDQPIPPYIAVHARRGDFQIWCNIRYYTPVDQCFAPLAAFIRRVEEVRAAILARTDVSVERVIVTSDEQDPGWWDSVAALGWLRPDHSATVDMHGPWYPMFIDAVIHAGAAGFVGTDTSTVSILARRRVESRGGVTEMVKWGKPGADDH
ncbi:hypothetical protein B0H17DRAFT_1060748 [Mycena rosella]|uniref:Uncharacterized protein n=1 Tax=Mycena rosella TaxID=1033263 RepID=A0AAD7DK01_MYCRO|nr:hypothetical protein B0H17DRAFT_1060748 [Mycena rosella]